MPTASPLVRDSRLAKSGAKIHGNVRGEGPIERTNKLSNGKLPKVGIPFLNNKRNWAQVITLLISKTKKLH